MARLPRGNGAVAPNQVVVQDGGTTQFLHSVHQLRMAECMFHEVNTYHTGKWARLSI